MVILNEKRSTEIGPITIKCIIWGKTFLGQIARDLSRHNWLNFETNDTLMNYFSVAITSIQRPKVFSNKIE